MSRPALYVPRAEARVSGLRGRARRRLSWWTEGAGQALASAGLPARALGERWRRHVPAVERARVEGGCVEIHASNVVEAPLPRGVACARDLPGDAGWFGFSFRDVPRRRAGATRLLRLHGARVLTARRPDGDYAPAILDARGTSLDLREIRYRPFHAAAARRAPDLTLPRAVWIAERVYHNHAHWLTAHLPKLALLREMGELGDLVLPAERGAAIDASLHRLGIEPADHPQLPSGAVLAAEELTVLETDRFRPELLRRARAAMEGPDIRPRRRLFVSRRSARGRRLLGEAALLPMLERLGFEAVEMERLDLYAQAALMAEAAAVVAPHGAGLANILFCRPGARVLEIADPAYPNPNFYAMAAGLGLDYGLLAAEGVGDRHPLDQDLAVEPDALRDAVEAML